MSECVILFNISTIELARMSAPGIAWRCLAAGGDSRNLFQLTMRPALNTIRLGAHVTCDMVILFLSSLSFVTCLFR